MHTSSTSSTNTPISSSTSLMNPQEYQQGIKRLRHLAMQEESAERTLTEIRIEKATLVTDMVNRTEHGQKAEIYEAAGVSQPEVSKDIAVKAMLVNYGSTHDLPSHSTLQIIAADSVPQQVRAQVLANPSMTQREVKAVVRAAKGGSKSVKTYPKADAYIIL